MSNARRLRDLAQKCERLAKTSPMKTCADVMGSWRPLTAGSRSAKIGLNSGTFPCKACRSASLKPQAPTSR